MSGVRSAKDDWEVIMKNARVTIATGRTLNFNTYLLVKWLEDKHKLNALESLQVAAEIVKSLPTVLMKHEIDTYILKIRQSSTQPDAQPDEHQ